MLYKSESRRVEKWWRPFRRMTSESWMKPCVEECSGEGVFNILTISSSRESENTDSGPGGKSYVSLEP